MQDDAISCAPARSPRSAPRRRGPRPATLAALAALAGIGALSTSLLHDAPSARAADATASAPPALSIPFTKRQLANGLTVILHQDRTLPLLAVNLTVKVGSRHEEPGRTGFAHLFEHLMFMGTERVQPKMFDTWMEAEGAWNNAWTSQDRTSYFDVGPARTLPLLLWMEADRFGTLDAAMTQQKLDAQREVVRNERRQQTENQPYGIASLRLPELMYPEGHPYHHPVIGSHEDLQAATVDDVRAFFRRFYVPNNLSLVVAGDFDAAEAMSLVERYFGTLEPRPLPEPPAAGPVVLKGVVRETLDDNVQLPKVMMAWHSPALFAPGDAELDLLAVVLEEGKGSRLYRALVHDRALAQEVSARQGSAELGSTFTVEAIARPGVSLDELERAIDVELATIRAQPVTESELRLAQNQYETSFVARLQSVAARAATLNHYETSRGDPGYVEKDLGRYRAATREGMLAHARAVLDPDARVVLRIVPRSKAVGSAAKGAK